MCQIKKQNVGKKKTRKLKEKKPHKESFVKKGLMDKKKYKNGFLKRKTKAKKKQNRKK